MAKSSILTYEEVSIRLEQLLIALNENPNSPRLKLLVSIYIGLKRKLELKK